ncbi:MAG: succinate dehydrogenase/fumarate reductase iron-sulfur subunit [Acidisphaera sp.]|nr:succinate dehydrogenase/fumarate reductase iron-sulfur subunit [Acidisphaera sp.]
MVRLKIFRYDPGLSIGPYYEEVFVPKTENMRVLDALNLAYETMKHGSLAHRWFCGTKKCGECAISVNGKPVLACWEAVSDDMTCEPLSNFPIIRDLVVDTENYERDVIMKLRPWMERRSVPLFPEKVGHEKMRAAHALSKCIECNVCSAAIPVEGVTPARVKYAAGVGTAALVRFTRFLLDPRDETDRRQLAKAEGMRPFPKFAVLRGVCPQGINILDQAILPANRVLFPSEAEGDVEDGGEPAIFIRASHWSAFVRLEARVRSALIEAGVLSRVAIPTLSEAYDLIESFEVGPEKSSGVAAPL